MPTDTENFVAELLERTDRRSRFLAGLDLILTVVANFLAGPGAARSLPVGGLASSFTAHDQLGEAWRHFRFHAGLTLLPLRLGEPASYFFDQLDRREAAGGKVQSQTELLCNQGGRAIGFILTKRMKGQISRQLSQELLTLTLAEGRFLTHASDRERC